MAERSYPTPEVRNGGREDLPHAKFRGGGQEEQPHLQGAAAVGRRRAERSHSTFKVSRSGGAAVRRYPSSKVRSSSCALMEQQ